MTIADTISNRFNHCEGEKNAEPSDKRSDNVVNFQFTTSSLNKDDQIRRTCLAIKCCLEHFRIVYQYISLIDSIIKGIF